MERFLAQIPELVDSDRRWFLYSDLGTLKLDNPEGYDEAIEFWSRFLLKLCRNGLGFSSEGVATHQQEQWQRRRHGHNDGISNTSSVGHDCRSSSDSDDDSKDGEEGDDVLDRIGRQTTDRLLRPVLCLSLNKLASRLSFRGDTPAGLDVVETEMRKRGMLVPAAEFFSTRLRRWAGWAVGVVLPSLPGRFVASLVVGAQVPKGMDSQTLVASPLVGDAAQRILDLHYSTVACPQMDNLMSIREFRRRFATTLCKRSDKQGGASKQRGSSDVLEMSGQDAGVLVKYLFNNRYIDVATVGAAAVHSSSGKQATASTVWADVGGGNETTLIKFASRHTERLAAKQAAVSACEPIGEVDRGVYQVKCTRTLLLKQIEQLETRVSDLDAQIRAALQRKQKNMAMSKLRSKHHIEDSVLTKRMAALEKVEKMYWQLEQSSSDIQVLHAFKAGARALRGLNEQAEDIDVYKAFDDWAQEAAMAAEVEDATRDGFELAMDTTALGIDADAELDAELDAIVAEEKKKESETRSVDKDGVTANQSGNESAESLADALENISITLPASPKKQRPLSLSGIGVEDSPQQGEDSGGQNDNKVPVPAE
ncbi:hypothetical protein IWW48_001799 [Coemansia sp. RSA 1200]|nr:hypothetical protein IWW48_001799 [Coemansia sp. RSA 1200]